MRSIVIDDVNFEEGQLITIMETFLNGENNGLQLRHLTLGNIAVDQEMMQFVFSRVLPSLYSLDLFNLKGKNGLH